MWVKTRTIIYRVNELGNVAGFYTECEQNLKTKKTRNEKILKTIPYNNSNQIDFDDKDFQETFEAGKKAWGNVDDPVEYIRNNRK